MDYLFIMFDAVIRCRFGRPQSDDRIDGKGTLFTDDNGD